MCRDFFFFDMLPYGSPPFLWHITYIHGKIIMIVYALWRLSFLLFTAFLYTVPSHIFSHITLSAFTVPLEPSSFVLSEPIGVLLSIIPIIVSVFIKPGFALDLIVRMIAVSLQIKQFFRLCFPATGILLAEVGRFSFLQDSPLLYG